MRHAPPVAPPVVGADNRSGVFRVLLWAVFFANSLFLIPSCLDRYLAPRFLFLSLVLLAGLFLLGRDLFSRKHGVLYLFDWLLLAWYLLNVASIGWAFNGSEAVFYTQKVALLVLTYWLVREALSRNEVATFRVLRLCTIWLTAVVGALVLGQLLYAVSQYGLNNERLYDYATGVYGNKSLAAAFLYFLLIFNVLFENGLRKSWLFWGRIGLLAGLVLLLQTRTVYMALAVSTLVYGSVRAVMESDFRVVFFKKIVPISIGLLALLTVFLTWKGRGNSLAERLNPWTYLESASANERRFVWYKTDVLNREHPWTGVGNGSWKFWFPSQNIQGAFRLQEQNIVFTRAHNDYLEVQAEMGWIGLVLFCALFVAVLCGALWAMHRSLDGQKRRDLLVLLVGVLGYCIIQFFDFPRERIEMQVVLAVFFAILVWDSREVWARLPIWQAGRKWMQVGFAVSILALVFNVVIGWNRVFGEIHAVRMLKAQSKSDHQRVVRESQKAVNRFYEYDDVAIPLVWYAGVAHAQLNQMSAALADFQAAYQLNPWSFHVMDKYAAALIQSKKHREAVVLLEKAVAINPKFEDGKFNLCYAEYQLGNFARSLEWLDQVDTIPNPQTEEQRSKNLVVLKKKNTFRQAIMERLDKQ